MKFLDENMNECHTVDALPLTTTIKNKLFHLVHGACIIQ